MDTQTLVVIASLSLLVLGMVQFVQNMVKSFIGRQDDTYKRLEASRLENIALRERNAKLEAMLLKAKVIILHYRQNCK